MRTCPKCHGLKRVWVEEPGHPEGGVRDACYHCGNTGEISEQQHFDNRLISAIGKLAQRIVNQRIDRVNANPEGEGWGFAAAENGMCENDYTQQEVWLEEEKLGETFKTLPCDLTEALVDCIEPEEDPIPHEDWQGILPHEIPNDRPDLDIPF